MTQVWDLALPAFDKLVLLALADCANDEGLAWPSIATLKRKSGAGERTIYRAIADMESLGILTIERIAGKGNRYTVTPAAVAPLPTSHPSQTGTPPLPVRQETPAAVAPKPSENHQEPSNQCAAVATPALKPEHIFEKWNASAARLGKPMVRNLTPERRQLLKARIGQYSIEDFVDVFGKVERSPFLRGDTGWRGCNFDWIFKKANFQKILEGNYDQ